MRQPLGHTFIGRLAALGVSVAVLWALFFVAGPRVVAHLPALRHYGEVQDIYGIRSGQLYYTDVEMSQQAEINSRSTWRFTPTGPKGAAKTGDVGRGEGPGAVSPVVTPVVTPVAKPVAGPVAAGPTPGPAN
ncbi:MAG TPA: hypothetical protein VE028_12510 [Nitratidesulfovibrio sp.]|nr:hypothetical protein [Nitratidesulfovibrio sp.]